MGFSVLERSIKDEPGDVGDGNHQEGIHSQRKIPLNNSGDGKNGMIGNVYYNYCMLYVVCWLLYVVCCRL